MTDLRPISTKSTKNLNQSIVFAFRDFRGVPPPHLNSGQYIPSLSLIKTPSRLESLISISFTGWGGTLKGHIVLVSTITDFSYCFLDFKEVAKVESQSISFYMYDDPIAVTSHHRQPNKQSTADERA